MVSHTVCKSLWNDESFATDKHKTIKTQICRTSDIKIHQNNAHFVYAKNHKYLLESLEEIFSVWQISLWAIYFVIKNHNKLLHGGNHDVIYLKCTQAKSNRYE